MMAALRVRDIMRVEPLCLKPDTEITAALRQLLAGNVSGAPVLDTNSHLVGILTLKDCIRAALDAHYHNAWGDSVKRYMSQPVETLDPQLALVNAAHFFTHTQYRQFPVVEDDQLVGQISRVDVLKALFHY